MKKGLVLAIALLLGLASSAGVYILLHAYDGGDSDIEEMVEVVVASKDIRPKERITIEDVKMKEIPRDLAHFEAATTVEQVVGLYAKDQLLAGEQVLQPRLIKGFQDYGIVIKIPAGHRAMTIPVDNTVGVSGFIRPGDYIDVIAGFNELIMGENIAKVVLEKVLVLATDRDLSEEKREPTDMENLTVAVTLKEAEKLAMALEHGSVRVALRPIESPETEVLKSPLTVASNQGSKPKTTKPAPPKQLSKLSVPPKPAPKPTSKPTPKPVIEIRKEAEKSVQATKTEEESKPVLVNNEPYLIEVIRGIERTLITVEDE